MKQSRYYPYNAFWRLAGLISLYLLGATAPAVAVVSDTQITDVTTRAFSVVWVSSEQVTFATVKVYSDAGGSNEITNLKVTLASPSEALLQGIAKVDVTGLEPGTEAYVQIIGPSGQVLSPNLLRVRMALESTKANPNNQPIVNDLILHKIFLPDGVNPAEGALLLVKVPKISSYPLTAFVGQGFTAPATVIDLNNLFNDTTGSSAEVSGGEALEVTEFRGLHCNNLEGQKLLHFRRAPVHEENPPITELESATQCFFADTVCDDAIDVLDVQRVLNIFNKTPGECLFNSDLDIVKDNVINILDVQSVLNRFGQKAPFNTGE